MINETDKGELFYIEPDIEYGCVHCMADNPNSSMDCSDIKCMLDGADQFSDKDLNEKSPVGVGGIVVIEVVNL